MTQWLAYPRPGWHATGGPKCIRSKRRSRTIGLPVVGDLPDARRAWRDDGLRTARCDQLTNGVAVISAIGDEAFERAQCFNECRRVGYVRGVAGCQKDEPRTALLVGRRVEFAGTSAPGRANRLTEGPPFAPAAERWALTCVASMAKEPKTGLRPVRASNIPNQMPWRLQRLKRL